MGPRSILTTSEDLQHMISYRLVSHSKPLGPGDIGTFKSPLCGLLQHSVDNLELRASRSNVCKVVEDMYMYYTYHL